MTMGWKNKRVKRNFVDYWLVVVRTDMVNENRDTEYYTYQSKDVEPNIFIDADNNNELNKELWTPVEKETFDESGSELMRSVSYTPDTDSVDQIKVDWIYFFSFRTEKVIEKERSFVSCADCEYYNNPENGPIVADGDMFWCDFRSGMYYYCPGYADLKTCHGCQAMNSASKGRCSYHAQRDSITGVIRNGDCAQWNRSGECDAFVEAFKDDEL